MFRVLLLLQPAAVLCSSVIIRLLWICYRASCIFIEWLGSSERQNTGRRKCDSIEGNLQFGCHWYFCY